MQELHTYEISQAIPGGIYYGEGRTVKICGSNCVDREVVAETLRADGVSVRMAKCFGSIGCQSLNGELQSGTYATVPMQTESGIVATEVIIHT
jgi:hypothetical protein